MVTDPTVIVATPAGVITTGQIGALPAGVMTTGPTGGAAPEEHPGAGNTGAAGTAGDCADGDVDATMEGAGADEAEEVAEEEAQEGKEATAEGVEARDPREERLCVNGAEEWLCGKVQTFAALDTLLADGTLCTAAAAGGEPLGTAVTDGGMAGNGAMVVAGVLEGAASEVPGGPTAVVEVAGLMRDDTAGAGPLSECVYLRNWARASLAETCAPVCREG